MYFLNSHYSSLIRIFFQFKALFAFYKHKFWLINLAFHDALSYKSSFEVSKSSLICKFALNQNKFRLVIELMSLKELHRLLAPKINWSGSHEA